MMWQRWSEVLFAHWPMEPRAVQATLPRGLEVEVFEDSAWVGVVPFKMEAIRPRGLPPVPGLSWFLEMNVRTYVRDRWGRSGVWFYSLDCNQALACAVARRFFRLNYRDATMAVAGADEMGWTSYSSRCLDAAGSAHLRRKSLKKTDPARPALEGTLEHFLVERYRLFAHDAERGRLLSGRVAHQPYRLLPATLEICEMDALFSSNGLPVPVGGPVHVVWSPGVQVRVFGVTAFA